MSCSPDALAAVSEYLAAALPELQAVYLYGSQATGAATADSDVDLTLLLPTRLAAEQRWQMSGEVAERLRADVDLLDLRQTSNALQYQVVTEGRKLWQRGNSSDEFELMVLSEYWDLAIQRRELIEDIKQRGSVYGR
ncbi:nucleotidyltransferase domain-containing protein [Halomonas sp. MCCC 1A11062]|uniref:type VII toxin-antitoxin system MntA family adenylyltransferase antitoxin n=1 Tax=Halomonas sp. MCCC 1A11062 TaxID=2733485 RepID=UPI001F42C937|nr:nucleotidyltransferase domain-containing protein [Halomonas sp. MCCC 1A11062]MCE8037388.1 nucleotidyltransferase domain-containing protein [Halomonas sp. MCCC 1A11062]